MKSILILGALVALGACVEQSIDGQQAFMEDCAGCHGADGKGAGEFGSQLLIVPPDLTHLSRDNGGVFPRDRVMSTIDGFHRNAHFSAAMPEFGEGDMGPTIMVGRTPIPARLLALAGYLEGIQE